MPRALITGISGQDGSYLAELLLSKGYQVFGLVRHSSTNNLSNIEHLRRNDQLTLLTGDMTDDISLGHAVEQARPDEVYNLAAQTFVPAAWAAPESTLDIIQLGTLRLLLAVKRIQPSARFLQAGTHDMLTKPSNPCSIAKQGAYWFAEHFRRQGLYVSQTLMHNHESIRRGPDFVTQKVAEGAARIKLGLQKRLVLGNMSAQRDWGFAGDFVEAMWSIMQQEHPSNYMIGTGQQRSVRDLLDVAFGHLDLNWVEHVVSDSSLLRDYDSNPSMYYESLRRTEELLSWRATKSFKQLITEMVDAQLSRWSVHRVNVRGADAAI